MTSTETLIRALVDRAELADLVARHSLWIDEGRQTLSETVDSVGDAAGARQGVRKRS